MTQAKDLVTASNGLAIPDELVAFFKQNAGVGSSNISGALPQLKVTEANSDNQGVDGKSVPVGCFYYQPTKEHFDTIHASILTISRGFYAMDNQAEPKPKFQQLLGGMMLDTMQPFVIFLGGTRLQNMWNFGKEIKPLTSVVPMFSLEVELGLEKTKTKYGANHVITFEVVRSNNKIALITDPELLSTLKEGVERMEGLFENFIEQNEVEKNSGIRMSALRVNQVYEDVVGDEPPLQEPPEDAQATKDISEDIPF